VSVKVKNSIRYFLLILFVSYAAGITLFTHSHVINGVTIVHSHPYNKDVPHSHSTVELDLLHLLNHFVSTSLVVVAITQLFIPLFSVTLFSKPIDIRYHVPYFGLAYLRAPPVLFS